MKTKRIPVLSHRYLVAGSGSGGGHCWPEKLAFSRKTLVENTVIFAVWNQVWNSFWSQIQSHTRWSHTYWQTLSKFGQKFTTFHTFFFWLTRIDDITIEELDKMRSIFYRRRGLAENLAKGRYKPIGSKLSNFRPGSAALGHSPLS